MDERREKKDFEPKIFEPADITPPDLPREEARFPVPEIRKEIPEDIVSDRRLEEIANQPIEKALNQVRGNHSLLDRLHSWLAKNKK